MSCTPTIALFFVALMVVIVAAREVARRVAKVEGPPPFNILLLTIIITLVVLQGAAQLPVLASYLVEQRGGDAGAVCAGQLPMLGFGATIVTIFGYALTFFLTWKRARA